MAAFVALQALFLVSAFGYSFVASQASDGRVYAWFPFPPIERSHWVVPVLKIVPTCLCLTLSLFAFDHGAHWFTVSYAVFLGLMVVIDYAIVAHPRPLIVLALASHLLSEATAVALVATTSLGARAAACYAAAAVVGGVVSWRVLGLGSDEIPRRHRRMLAAYALLLVVLAGSYLALALSPAPFPPLLRASFAGTAILVPTTDSLWARWEFRRKGTKLGVASTYYAAIWSIAMNMVLFAPWAAAHGAP